VNYAPYLMSGLSSPWTTHDEVEVYVLERSR